MPIHRTRRAPHLPTPSTHPLSVPRGRYNACLASAALSPHAYALTALAVCITAVSSVWNQKVVKGFAVAVNLQNALLYVFGTVIALISYAAIPDDTHPHGFFHGYSLLAIFLVVFQVCPASTRFYPLLPASTRFYPHATSK